MKKYLCIGLLLLTGIGLSLHAGEHAVIVLSEHASPAAKFAAEELRSALKRCTGIRAELRDDRKELPETGRIFIVGPGRFCTLAPELPYDHYLLQSKGRITILAGKDDDQDPLTNRFLARTGTLYAVYRYLYAKLGVRMVWPGSTGEIYPRGPLPQGDFNLSGGPKLPIRHAYYGNGGRHPAASLRNAVRWGRFNGMGTSLVGSVGHASTAAIGLERYKTHPEYYALHNGKRIRPVGNRWKLCHSNPALPGLFAEWGIAHPQYKDYFPVSANDSSGWCECEECRKLDAGQQSAYQDGLCVSGRMFTLANRTARETARRNSPKQVAIYAYSEYVDPPADIEKLDDRIILFIARGIYWNTAPSVQKQFQELFDAWSKKTDKLVLRDYRNYGLPMILYPYPRLAFRTIRYLRKRFPNFMGINICGDDCRAHALWGPTGYVYAHLLWDPEQELEPLLEDYYRSAWPKSHQIMRRYFEYFEQRVSAEISREDRLFWPHRGGDDIVTGWKIMAPEAVAFGRSLLAEARRAAAGDKAELERIDFIATGLDAAETDRACTDALMHVAAFSGSLTSMPKHPEPSNADRRQLLQNAIQAIDAYRGFMRKHVDHEGIPSVMLSYKRGLLDNWEDTVRYLYSLYSNSSLRILLPDGWKFSPDPKDAGVKKEWFSPAFDDQAWSAIRTDAPWETQGFPGYNGAAWYRRKIEIPARWKEFPLELILGAVDESFDVWFDGKLLQSYRYDPEKDPEAWQKERRIPLGIPAPGAHHIAIRVHDKNGNGGIWKMAQLQADPPDLFHGKGLAHPGKGVVKKDNIFLPGNSREGRFPVRARITPGQKYVLRAVFCCQEKEYFYKIPVTVKVQCKTVSKRNTGSLFQAGLVKSDLKPGTEQFLELTFAAPADAVSADCTLFFRVPKFAAKSFELRPL